MDAILGVRSKKQAYDHVGYLGRNSKLRISSFSVSGDGLAGRKMATKGKEQILCFAYGSNMLSSRMKHPDRVPSAKPLDIGYITGYRLTFDKVSKDGSGKCDAEVSETEKDLIYGVLYTVEKTQKPKLDIAEGLGNGYLEKPIDVITARGRKRAVMYYATSKDPSLKPFHWYKSYVVAGAVEHQLPFPYIEWLRTVESMQDPDAARRAKEERLLIACKLTTRGGAIFPIK